MNTRRYSKFIAGLSTGLILLLNVGTSALAAAGDTMLVISGNAGVAGATLRFDDGGAQTVTVDGLGEYSFEVSYNWSGAVTPSLPGYTFSPFNPSYTHILADQTGQNYTATLNTYALSVIKVGGTGHGMVTSNPVGINCSTSCSALFNYNTVVTLNATANPGDTFFGWGGSICSGIGTCTVTVTADGWVSFDFESGIFYNLSVNKTGSGSGTVTSDYNEINCGATCFHLYPQNRFVTLTTTVNTGSTFTGWSGYTCPGTGTCVVLMDAARSVTANFTLKTYALTVDKTGTGSGTVTSNPAGIDCGSDCSETYDYNSSVTLTATADTGSTFTGWSGSDCSGTDTCTVLMNAARSVTANYTKIEYTLAVYTSGGGLVLRSNPGPYYFGDVVELTPITVFGWKLSAWGGACTGTGACSVTMDEDKFVSATFIHIEYSLTIVSANGTVTKNPNQATYYEGDIVQLTSIPNAGWAFANWTGDLTSSVNPDSVTIHGNTSVTANYTLITCQIYLPLVKR